MIELTPPLEADDALPRPSQSAEPFLVGTWLSLVEHSLGVRGVGSSNLPVPTNSTFLMLFARSFTSFRISPARSRP